MKSLTSLFKLLFVFTFLIGVLCLAFFAFFVLLGLACAISIILWVKTVWARRTHLHSGQTAYTTTLHETSQGGMIIEGEAEEIKEPNQN